MSRTIVVKPRRTLPQPDPAQRAAVDWWVYAVPIVVALELLLLAGLYTRMGSLGLWMWYLGPITVVLYVELEFGTYLSNQVSLMLSGVTGGGE